MLTGTAGMSSGLGCRSLGAAALMQPGKPHLATRNGHRIVIPFSDLAKLALLSQFSGSIVPRFSQEYESNRRLTFVLNRNRSMCVVIHAAVFHLTFYVKRQQLMPGYKRMQLNFAPWDVVKSRIVPSRLIEELISYWWLSLRLCWAL